MKRHKSDWLDTGTKIWIMFVLALVLLLGCLVITGMMSLQ